MSAATRITDVLVKEWTALFLLKNRDYNSKPMPGFPEGFENADVLGVPGQFGEIWRKIWKLKKGMWDKEELTGEPVREVLMDLIGHCFLAIDMLDREAKQTSPVTERPWGRQQRIYQGKKYYAMDENGEPYICGHDCGKKSVENHRETHSWLQTCRFRPENLVPRD